MTKITVILPISRLDNLKRVLRPIVSKYELNLLAIVDIDYNLREKISLVLSESDLIYKIVYLNNKKGPLHDISSRRLRICEIHNEAKKHIDSDFVFGVEDDTVIPEGTIDTLVENYGQFKNIGLIEGVEMGRWGVPYVGAWRFDNVENPSLISSILPKTGLEEIDGSGFYCFLVKAELYKNHDFGLYENNLLGPDVEFSVSLRKQGLQNYINWDIDCIHISNKEISLRNTKPKIIEFRKTDRWRQNIVSKEAQE
jgi:hypothetical protein